MPLSRRQGTVRCLVYSYCDNNPINFIDPNGDFPLLVVVVIAVCGIAGGVLGYYSQTDLVENAINQTEDPLLEQLPPMKPLEFQEQEDEKIKKLKKVENDPDIAGNNESTELTTGERVTNTLVGAGLEIVVGGGLVSCIGAIGGLAVGSVSVTIPLLGGTAKQIFALGALAYNSGAICFSSFFGIEMEPIEITP